MSFAEFCRTSWHPSAFRLRWKCKRSGIELNEGLLGEAVFYGAAAGSQEYAQRKADGYGVSVLVILSIINLILKLYLIWKRNR